MKKVAFIDIEFNPSNKKITDTGCILTDDAVFHKNDPNALILFVEDSDFICGHNILSHDLPALRQYSGNHSWGSDKAIDTLYLSALLFPKNPYHKLVKNEKLDTEERNNPVNDAIKARHVLHDSVNAFKSLDEGFQRILFGLLGNQIAFQLFFRYLDYSVHINEKELEDAITKRFYDKICSSSNISSFIYHDPVALAYSLALLNCHDRYSITPPWVLKNFPGVERMLFLLKNNPCLSGCSYCHTALDPVIALKKYFGFPQFRKYADEPLQEKAVNAAIRGKSLLAVFPTGGGKSITFQVPALMSGENAKALTVVISPLQSLMKDQVDNLEQKNITEAVTINGLLDPIERGKSIERIENGYASLLYISPESLRSNTIERLLLKRKIARFVIDEAHCFSSWGQDFRVDYLYIGDFIKNLQEKKNMESPIPVSCFTATAKQKVIEDIREYFLNKLGLTLELFSSNAGRTNLHYNVHNNESDDEKYNKLRDLIELKACPTIVYVSRTKRAYELSKRLSEDGYPALAYHGKMDKEEKTTNQNDFMNGVANIMVATSAFGMGVDKADVGAVIHYDISDSLENYVQEAGRAGRDEKIQADCHVLFNDADLDKHFILLNQTKISSKEINQVWKAIKSLTQTRDKVSHSALEIARKAGWDDTVQEIETRVKTAVAALEEAGYIKRGQNNPRLFASSILSKTAEEAITKIRLSQKFSESEKKQATRIIKKLFSSKSKRLTTDEVAESRVDYISDQLGIHKKEVIRAIELLREEKIIADTKDLTAFIKKTEAANRSLAIVENFKKQEDLLLDHLSEPGEEYNLKEIIENMIEHGVKDCSVQKLKTIINFWSVKLWIYSSPAEYSKNHIYISLKLSKAAFKEKQEKRHLLSGLITKYLFSKAATTTADKAAEEILVEFSILELKEAVEKPDGLFKLMVSIDEIEDCLFYLSRIEAIKIEGGFLVLYNALSINRIEKNNRIQYKDSDYEKLKQFYQQKVQQIHIVGEYAKKMISDYEEALKFVDDYFKLNYSSFLSKYFPGSRIDDIRRPLTPEKFRQLFGELSPAQLSIIKDDSDYIVVAAGPGSGKTRVLVHKLASLLLTEDVKHEQLLMLTFSRAAATEFKKRLLGLIGNAAHFVEIKTFHSYCFDLLGRIGKLGETEDVLQRAVEKIRSGEIEQAKITKTVLVVDEAQDMNADEYSLVKALMEQNEEMRVILVGDDDQNIYQFRGADSRYMQNLVKENEATKFELTENYRSAPNIVEFSNQWALTMRNRLKEAPCFSTRQQHGAIEITGYNNQPLAIPVATVIQNTALTGTTCVITKTNEEAMQIAGLLNRNNIPAKLIQSNDQFNLDNLYELRYFQNLIDAKDNGPIVSQEDWDTAKQQLNQHIATWERKEMVAAVIKAFEEVNKDRKYKSDWKSFVSESKLSDFYQADSETIFVSTIHKTKGKEFNNVFLALKDFDNSEEEKREFYVAVTRAQSNLYIHYNGNFLQPYEVENLLQHSNNQVYPEANEIVLLPGHKDIWLGYFEFAQYNLTGLYNGALLKIADDGLLNTQNKYVLKYSKRFLEILQAHIRRGYELKAAKVNFIVYWYNEETKRELKIVLPRLLLRREN